MALANAGNRNNFDFSAIPVAEIKFTKQEFPEIPDMLFGKDPEGVDYFDATALLIKRELPIDKVGYFLIDFTTIINALSKELNIKRMAVCVDSVGHYAFHESLKIPFLCYIDREFLRHIHHQLVGLFESGVAYSDSYIAQLAYTRLSPAVLRSLADGAAEEQQ